MCQRGFFESDQDPDYLDGFPGLHDKLKNLFKGLGPALRPEMILGDFKIIRELGAGGMSVVYEAFQVSLQRHTALKVLSPHLSLSRHAIEKFHREAVAGGRQSHPGIVTVYEMGEYEGIYYIAQELVPEGRTLADRLLELEGEPPDDHYRFCARMAAQAADALDHAHRSGVIHRDVKPSNILLTKDHRVKLTDFGLARVEDALSLSRTGDFSGTPFYMSPEQAMGEKKRLDLRTDVFSLGVTLYESMTLKRPFDGDTSHDVIKKILFHEPASPNKINKDAPRDLSLICMKAMEKEPKRRYPTMADFSEDLNRFLDGKSVRARPVSSVRRILKPLLRRKSMTLTLVMMFLFLVVTGYAFHRYAKNESIQLNLVRERYQPMETVLRWRDLHYAIHPTYWCSVLDPRDASGALLEALVEYNFKNYGKVSSALDKEFAGSPLKKDAHYLKYKALTILSEDPALPLKAKRDLLEKASKERHLSGAFNPLTEDALIWRDDTKTIRIDSDHPLMHIFTALFLFENLYKGGTRSDFMSTIAHLDSALQTDSFRDNLIALTVLGRVYYFYARFYGYMELTEKALAMLHRALEVSRPQQYPFIHLTMGQIRMLRGENEQARRDIEMALQTNWEKQTFHNVYRCMGIFAIQDEKFDRAFEYFEKAHEYMPRDVHTYRAKAELFLMKGDPNQALHYCDLAKRSAYEQNPGHRIRKQDHIVLSLKRAGSSEKQ